MQREALQRQLGVNDHEAIRAIIREALASQAGTAIIPAQDLLELGSEARMNFRIAKGNWEWRLKEGALTPELAHRLKRNYYVWPYGGGNHSELHGPGSCSDGADAERAYELYGEAAAGATRQFKTGSARSGNRNGGETMIKAESG